MRGALVAGWLVAACAPGERPSGALWSEPRPDPAVRRPPPDLRAQPGFAPPMAHHGRIPDVAASPHLPRFPGGGAGVLPPLWTRAEGVVLDPEAGQAMQARLDEFPQDLVDQQSVALLTPTEMWGTEANDYEDGLCEPLRGRWQFEEGGESWEAVLQLAQYNHMLFPPEPLLVELTATCGPALDLVAPADAVAAGDCVEQDELSFFREGTQCRGCLDEGTGLTQCRAEAACPDTAPLTFWWLGYDGGTALVETGTTFMYACAPDLVELFYVLSIADDDPALPAPWDNPAWFGYCLAYTDETTGEIVVGCLGEYTNPPSEGHVLGEGAPTRILNIAREGDDQERGWWDRPAFLQGFTVGSWSLDWFWAGPSPGLGPVSASSADQGWGVNPGELRPDGLDTFARDWVAAYTMKTSTARNGVIVSFDNHNRCTEDGWVGPDDRGRWRCEEMTGWTEGWSEDGAQFEIEGGMLFSIPIRTLASTGLPDPAVPGGLAIHVACSPIYEQIEDWTCTHGFEPDLVPYDDVPYGTEFTGTGAFEGESYRFGKDPDWDIRMILGSNWDRFHRPLDGAGEQP
jgi:hypothetical protein